MFAFFAANSVQFPFQILVSEGIFLVKAPRRDRFFPRFVGGIALQFLLSHFWELFMSGFYRESYIPYIILYIGYALWSVIPIMLGFDISPQELLFTVVGGYATEHMSFSLSRLILPILRISYLLTGDYMHLFVTRYLIFVLGAALVYLLMIRKYYGKRNFEMGDTHIALLGLVLIISAIGLSVYWSYPEEYLGTIFGDVICPAYSFLCSLLVLIMEYYVLWRKNMQREQEAMEQLLQLSHAQQRSSREAIDIINIKCHDLKHQIKNLEKIDDSRERAEYIREINGAVSIYDALYHTGCVALDYVLREKTLLFNEHNVKFSCMVDGEILQFMSTADIYALMGNALDNALERVLQEKKEEQVISLLMKKNGNMGLLHLENRCSREVEFKDGLPITDKKDKNRHGFGVKSICYIVEKYNGEVMMNVQNGKFCLDILFRDSQ